MHYPSYETELGEGTQVSVLVHKPSTLATRKIETLAPPNEMPPPVRTPIVVRDEAGTMYRGTVGYSNVDEFPTSLEIVRHIDVLLIEDVTKA